MKNATECATNFTALIDSLPAVEPSTAGADDDPIDLLVKSFLLWETTQEKADGAWDKIQAAIVDRNDLRVSMPHEVLAWIGSRYPKGQIRCERIRAVLKDIYMREHEMTLTSLGDQGKRDIRKYLDSLNGMVPYVASRVMMLVFGVHAMPVDAVLRRLLINAGAAEEESTELEIGVWLTRQVRAADGTKVYATLQAWADKNAGIRLTPAKSAASTKKSGAKKTGTKKTGTKKTVVKKTETKKTPASKAPTSKTTAKKTTTPKTTAKKSTTKKTPVKKKSRSTKPKA